MTHKYLLIDGNNLAMRSVHASWNTTTLSTTNGIPTAALMIFINSLTKLIADECPTHVGVAWDGRSAFRNALLPSYKANRKASPVDGARDDAFSLMKGFLVCAGIQSELSHDHEADDIIASWWWVIEGTGDDAITIASGDKDLLQLLGSNPCGVQTYAHRFGDTEGWDQERFADEMGYFPERWPLIGALTGDASDNIIGIRGIGPKKALKLLERHDWDLEAAVAEEYPDHLEQIKLNFRLMNLQGDPLIDVTPPVSTLLPEYGTDGGRALDEFLTKFELVSIQARYRRGQLWSMPAQVGRAFRSRASAGKEGT